MNQIVLHRNLSLVIACSDGMRWARGDTSYGRQDKSPDLRLGYVVGWIEIYGHWVRGACWRLFRKVQRIQCIGRHRSPFYGCRRP
jgi:hypothetical protein